MNYLHQWIRNYIHKLIWTLKRCQAGILLLMISKTACVFRSLHLTSQSSFTLQQTPVPPSPEPPPPKDALWDEVLFWPANRKMLNRWYVRVETMARHTTHCTAPKPSTNLRISCSHATKFWLLPRLALICLCCTRSHDPPTQLHFAHGHKQCRPFLQLVWPGWGQHRSQPVPKVDRVAGGRRRMWWRGFVSYKSEQ